MVRLYLIVMKKVKFVFFILEIFLSNFKQDKKVYCPCKTIFDCNLAINMMYSNQENLNQKANERLVIICKKICLICQKDCSSSNNQRIPGQKIKYHILKVIENRLNKKISEYSTDDHILCNDCVSIVKSNLTNKMKKKEIKPKDKTYPVECSICDTLHQIDSTNLGKIIKSETGGCCQIL